LDNRGNLKVQYDYNHELYYEGVTRTLLIKIKSKSK